MKSYWKDLGIENLVNIEDGKMEEWMPINGYEGLYQVSNLGRVKGLGRRFVYASFGYITTEDKIISQKVATTKYLDVRITKNSKAKSFSVHRLVAEAFIKNELSKKTVNHIDSDRSNNYYKNLEWNTYSENAKHSFKMGRNAVFQTYHDGAHPMAQRIKCTTLDLEFDTVKDACKKLNVNRSSILQVCKGKIVSTKGLHFRRMASI